LALVAVTTETLLGVLTPSTVDDEAAEEEEPPPPPKSLQPDINAKITRTTRTPRALKNDLAIGASSAITFGDRKAPANQVFPVKRRSGRLINGTLAREQ
jgi:hypothetical protein